MQSVFAQIYDEAMIRTDNDSNTTTELSTITQQATNSNGLGSGTIYNGNQDNVFGATGEAESPFNFEARPSTNAGDEQSSFAPASSTTDFRSFLDSFVNGIFNGTSAFGAVGTSIVNDADVSGIWLDKSQNQLSVTLTKTSGQDASYKTITSNQSITMPGTTERMTTTTAAAGDSSSVSIIAIRIPINMNDILSLAAASSSSFSSSFASSNGNILDDAVQSQGEVLPSDNFNPISLPSNLQIGSTILTDFNWSEAQLVTMNVVGNSAQMKEQQSLSSSDVPMTDLVLVLVIRYTGLTGNGTEGRAISSG